MPNKTDVDEIYERAQQVIDYEDGNFKYKLDLWLTNGGKNKLTSGRDELASDIVAHHFTKGDIYKVDTRIIGDSNLQNTISRNLQSKVRDIIDPYFNSKDVAGLKRQRFDDSKLQEIRNNLLYNLIYSRVTESSRANDLGALRELREQVKGTGEPEQDFGSRIEREIERLSR